MLDAHDGSVVAMASHPTFHVDKFTNGIPADEFKTLTDPAQHFPLINRAMQGLYAPGSTFKLFTSIAALEDGVDHARELHVQRPAASSTFGGRPNKQHVPQRAARRRTGSSTSTRALTVSSDVFFYNVGFLYFRQYGTGLPEHRPRPRSSTASSGSRARSASAAATGIGLPERGAGRVPDLSFKQAFNKGNPDGSTQVWLPGDGANLAVGQGDLLVTPLQLATAYAAFANGGILYQPRVATKILENSGDQRAEQGRARPAVAADRRGSRSRRRSATRSCRASRARCCTEEGTAYGAFQGYPCNVVAGKTGTAQTGGTTSRTTRCSAGSRRSTRRPADSGSPQYVVCVVVEQGGFGGSVAAPIARRIFDDLHGDPNPAPVHVSPPKTTTDGPRHPLARPDSGAARWATPATQRASTSTGASQDWILHRRDRRRSPRSAS